MGLSTVYCQLSTFAPVSVGQKSFKFHQLDEYVGVLSTALHLKVGTSKSY